jgi:AcrR family transcriptional regulator
MPGRGAPTPQGAAPAAVSDAHSDFAPAQIGQIQRGRLLAAMAQVADELGVANLTVANVVTRAGVSRRTFYELFRDCEDCLLAAIEDAVGRASARVLLAYETQAGAWHLRIRAALVALLELFDEQPHTARLLVLEWLAAGPPALERRQRLLGQLAIAVDEGRHAAPGRDAAVPELTAEGIVGAVVSLLHARLLSRAPGLRLVGFANSLMAVIVLPYLGPEASRKEVGRALPKVAVDGRGDAPAEDVFKGLNMRLTYRTMRVLAAVSANPGGSNRTIARAAGIGDQGQISKLLMRLRKLGLVENRGVPVKGEPNAWMLSAKGTQVEQLLARS